MSSYFDGPDGRVFITLPELPRYRKVTEEELQFLLGVNEPPYLALMAFCLSLGIVLVQSAAFDLSQVRAASGIGFAIAAVIFGSLYARRERARERLIAEVKSRPAVRCYLEPEFVE